MSLINYQIIVLTEKFSNFGGSFIGRSFFTRLAKIIFAEIFLHVLTRLGSMLIKVCAKAIKNIVVIEEAVTVKIMLKITKSKCRGQRGCVLKK